MIGSAVYQILEQGETFDCDRLLERGLKSMNTVFRGMALACVMVCTLMAAGCSKEKPEETSPTPAQVLEMGVKALHQNEIDKAINAFSLIVQKAKPGVPERAAAYAYLGQIAYRAGNMDLAIENFQNALKENPKLMPVRFALGNAYFGAKRLKEAAEVWEVVVQEDPGQISARNNLGVAYLDMGDYESATRHLEAAISLAPDNLRAQENLATAYRKLGRTQEADTAERKAAAIRERLAARQKQQAAGQPPQ